MIILLLLTLVILGGIGVSALKAPFSRNWHDYNEQKKAFREYGKWNHTLLWGAP